MISICFRGLALKRFKLESIYSLLLLFTLIISASVIFFIAFFLFVESIPALSHYGPSIFVETKWDPFNKEFGIAPFIISTILCCGLAIIVATPLGVLTAIFITEYCPEPFRSVLHSLFEIFAAFPSILVGMWGYLVLAPILRDYIQPFLVRYLGFIPLFQGSPRGFGVMAGVIVLTIMILPTLIVISEEAIKMVPRELKEAAFSLGATKTQTVFRVVVPTAIPGIGAGILLAIGRAIGETMAVLMVTGNTPKVPTSILDTCYLMTSLIANEFGYAAGIPLYRSVLFVVAFILLLLSLLFMASARIIIFKMRKKMGLK